LVIPVSSPVELALRGLPQEDLKKKEKEAGI
jgi:hypothetical protein